VNVPRLAPLALLAVLALPASAAGPGCRGTLSGAAAGAFTCDVSFSVTDEGRHVFVVNPRGPIDGVPSYAPGAFELPGPPRPGTYTLSTLGPGRASVAAEGGTLYTATKTSSERGEVTLVLASVREAPGGKGLRAHGTYRARLVPAGGGKSGEVVIEVVF
jgi:hypothetical protein